MSGFLRHVLRWRRSLRIVFFAYFIFLMLLLVWWKSDRKFKLLGPSVLDSANYDLAEVNRKDQVRESAEIVTSLHRSKDIVLMSELGKQNRSRGFKWGPLDEDFQKRYFGNKQEFCRGGLIGISNLLAFIRNISVNPIYGQGRKGGENISSVINQPENAEYFTLGKGYFSINCSDGIAYRFTPKSHLNSWKDALQTELKVPNGLKVISDWTIAVMRYEYANLYHTMTDFYATFLVAKSFKIDLTNLNILWIDGHPLGALDTTWKVLFGNVTRAGELQQPVLYQNMVWGIMGYDSLLNKHDSPSVPYLEEFRSFFLTRHGISDKYTLDCTHLNVLLIWRRDYLAHPRNPTGKVTRKIKNEDELLAAITDLLPDHQVVGVQIDKLTMEQQLQAVSTTDILIGMHGAGLSHTLFLPQHAGLVELYPTYWPSANKHFRMMAKWRKMHYSTWSNSDHARELPNHFTIVDVKAVINMVHETHHKLCGDRADA